MIRGCGSAAAANMVMPEPTPTIATDFLRSAIDCLHVIPVHPIVPSITPSPDDAIVTHVMPWWLKLCASFLNLFARHAGGFE